MNLISTRLSRGRRRVSHPGLPALLERRRRCAIRTGSAEITEALAVHPATAVVLAATQAQLDREDAALGLAERPGGTEGYRAAWQRAALSWVTDTKGTTP